MNNRSYDLSRYYKKHPAKKEKKLVMEKICGLEKRGYNQEAEFVCQKSCDSLATLKVSYKIAFMLAKKHKPFSAGEEMVKPCFQKFAQLVGDKSIEKKVNEVTLSQDA